MRSCSNGWWLQEQRLDQSTMLLEKLWQFTCGELSRATLCIDWCTYLKELYPSREAINIRCPKIKSLHNLISPTRSIFLSSSCSREFQYTSRYSNLSLWGMKERKRCWGDLQVGTPFPWTPWNPWTPTQRSTDAPSIGPQWTFLLRDVPLERSETPELQTHEVRHRNEKKQPNVYWWLCLKCPTKI